MELVHSFHWKLKKAKRTDISDDLIKLAIYESDIIKDRNDKLLYNAIFPIPPMGRRLKVVYRREKDKFKIITAFWID